MVILEFTLCLSPLGPIGQPFQDLPTHITNNTMTPLDFGFVVLHFGTGCSTLKHLDSLLDILLRVKFWKLVDV